MINNFLTVLGEWRTLVDGLITTLWISGLSVVIAFPLSLLFAVIMHASFPTISWMLRLVVDIFRAIPFLMLLFIGYYCLPEIGLRASAITVGLTAMVIYNASYFSEILRGGLSVLPNEQTEAGRAYGFHGLRLYRFIIFPQVIVAVSPMLGNQTISLIKNSAFLMVITVPELTASANQIQAIHFVPLEAMLVAVLMYWVICLFIEAVVRRLDSVAQTRGKE